MSERGYQRAKRRAIRELRGEHVGRTQRRACEHCGKVVGLYVPSRGDGSMMVYRWHRDERTGERCEFVKREPPADLARWDANH